MGPKKRGKGSSPGADAPIPPPDAPSQHFNWQAYNQPLSQFDPISLAVSQMNSYASDLDNPQAMLERTHAVSRGDYMNLAPTNRVSQADFPQPKSLGSRCSIDLLDRREPDTKKDVQKSADYLDQSQPSSINAMQQGYGRQAHSGYSKTTESHHAGDAQFTRYGMTNINSGNSLQPHNDGKMYSDHSSTMAVMKNDDGYMQSTYGESMQAHSSNGGMPGYTYGGGMQTHYDGNVHSNTSGITEYHYSGDMQPTHGGSIHFEKDIVMKKNYHCGEANAEDGGRLGSKNARDTRFGDGDETLSGEDEELGAPSQARPVSPRDRKPQQTGHDALAQPSNKLEKTGKANVGVGKSGRKASGRLGAEKPPSYTNEEINIIKTLAGQNKTTEEIADALTNRPGGIARLARGVDHKMRRMRALGQL